MERAYKSLTTIVSSMEKLVEHLEAALQADSSNHYLESHSHKLENKWDIYEAKWEEYSDRFGDKEGHVEKEQQHGIFTERYYDIQLRISTHIKQNPNLTRDVDSPSITSVASVNLKLPEIKIKDFFGEPLDWTRFWNQFSSLIDSRDDINPVAKYAYLSQSLKGAAQHVLAGFRGEPTDYEDAVTLLKNTYGDKNKIRRALIRTFLNLEKPKYNYKEIHRFKTKLENVLMQFSHDPQLDISNCEPLVSEIICQKFPRELEKFLFSLYKTVYFTIDQIKEGLQNLLDVMTPNELVEDKEGETRRDINEFKPFNKNNKLRHSWHFQRTKPIGTYVTLKKEVGKNAQACIFCQRNHPSPQCETYATVSQRQARLKVLNRCSQCLGFHTLSQCQTYLNTCSTCRGGKHHSYLCPRGLDLSKTGARQPGPEYAFKAHSTEQFHD